MVKDLRVAFGLTNAELNAHVVRLSVLYEDLKIELTGSGGTLIPRLEFYGKSARQQYFIRRTFATLYEFRECCGLPVFFRRSSSSDVLRLKSLRDRR